MIVRTVLFFYLLIMELIPIIYTVLKIVAVLSFVTIAVSYFLYKTRQSRGKVASSGHRIIQPATPERSMIKIIKRITKTRPHPLPADKSSLRSRKADNTKVKPIIKEPDSQKKQIEKQEFKTARITVIKNLEPQKTQTDHTDAEKQTTQKTKIPAEETQLSSLGDKILDKYDEDNGNDMYALNVKKKEDMNKKN